MKPKVKKLISKPGDSPQGSVKLFTPILDRFKDKKFTQIQISNIGKIYKVDTSTRRVCLIQANISTKISGWRDFYRVFEFVDCADIKIFTVPIAIAPSADYTVVEIVEEFAGIKLVDALKEKVLTQEEKEKLYHQILYEGATAIAMLDGRLFHSNICASGLLTKYGNIRISFTCFGKFTLPDGTIPKGTTLNIIDKTFLAPELHKSLNKMDIVVESGIDAGKADVYSLGLCLLNTIGDYRTADKLRLQELRYSNNEEFEKEIDKLNGKVSSKLFTILRRMLSPNPLSRITAAEIVEIFKEGDIFNISTLVQEKGDIDEKLRFGQNPAARTQVLEKAKIEENSKLRYICSDKIGSIFLVDSPTSQYILLKSYIFDEKDVKHYEALFNYAQTIAKDTGIVSTPIDYHYNETTFEWLDEFSGMSVEKIRNYKKIEKKGESKMCISDIVAFFAAALQVIKAVEGVLFLAKISRNSILFWEQHIKWGNIRFAHIIENGEGIIKPGERLYTYYKLTSAPEVIASVDEITQTVTKEFKGTPADIYALGLTIFSMLCDMDNLNLIDLIENRCKSSDCFEDLLKEAGVPTQLSEILTKFCLLFNPQERSSPSAIIEKLNSIDVETIDYEETKNPPEVKVEEAVSYILPKTPTAAAEPKKEKRKYMFSKTSLLDQFEEVKEMFWKQGGQGKIIKVETEKGLFALKIMTLSLEQARDQEKAWRALQNVKYCIKALGREYSEDFGSYEILMEFCEKNLDDVKNELIQAGSDSFPFDKLIIWFKQCIICMAELQGLSKEEIHFYHGDLNPRNILLKNEEVRIADFGCAKAMGLSTILAGKLIEGYTPLYAAPEIFKEQLLAEINENTYVKSDVFSLGMCFLELASLWKKEKMSTVIQKRTIEKGRMPIEEIDSMPGVSVEFKEILKQMLQEDYTSRIDFKSLLSLLE